MTERVRKAMAAAKKLEAQDVPSEKDIVKVYRRGMKTAEQLKGMLKPSWFVECPREKRKVYKSRRASSSRR